MKTSIQIIIVLTLIGLLIFTAYFLNIVSFHSIQWTENQPLKNPVRVTEITDTSLVLEDGRKIIFEELESYLIDLLNSGGNWIEIHEEINVRVTCRYARYHVPVHTFKKPPGLITIPIFRTKLPKYEKSTSFFYEKIIDPNH